jgi:hypothetical protein
MSIGGCFRKMFEGCLTTIAILGLIALLFSGGWVGFIIFCLLCSSKEK